jgi:hypothetical protein
MSDLDVSIGVSADASLVAMKFGSSLVFSVSRTCFSLSGGRGVDSLCVPCQSQGDSLMRIRDWGCFVHQSIDRI